MISRSRRVTSFSLCKLSQRRADPEEVSGGREKGFGALWLCWKILLISSGGRPAGKREEM